MKQGPVGLKLGNLTLDVPFFQASLSGYSDYTMRMFARRYGCSFALTDVMLAKSVARPDILAGKRVERIAALMPDAETLKRMTCACEMAALLEHDAYWLNERLHAAAALLWALAANEGTGRRAS